MRKWYAAGIAFLVLYSPITITAEEMRFTSRIDAERSTISDYYRERKLTFLEALVACDGEKDNVKFDFEQDNPEDFVIVNGKCKEKPWNAFYNLHHGS